MLNVAEVELADDGFEQKECYYMSAACNYKAGRFGMARNQIMNCLRVQPGYSVAEQFLAHLNERTKAEGKSGLIIFSSLVIGIAVFILLRQSNKN